MARFQNYRYVNLVKLITALSADKPVISDIRLIDRECGTTYYTDLINARDWPPYIVWFGLTDMISDLVSEYLFNTLSEDEVGELETKGKKLSAISEPAFTPTINADLRTELDLDAVERGWFGFRKSIHLEREVRKSAKFTLKTSVLSANAQSNLAYALHAFRTKRWPLAAFCFAQFVSTEFEVKYILMKDHAIKNGLQLAECPTMHIPDSFLELMRFIQPEVDRDNLSRFCLWSEGSALSASSTLEHDKYCDALIDFMSRVHARIWPSREHVHHIADLILTNHAAPYAKH